MKKCLPWIITLSATAVLFAQSGHAAFSDVYVGHDGLAHVVDAAGKDVAFPKVQGQVAVDLPQVSPDKQSVGWEVEEDNCCTSYPIPTSVLVYHNGKQHRVGTGQMVYDWCFINDGKEIALSAGPVHNPEGQDLRLYDTESGKQLQEWYGDLDADRPAWAECIGQP